MNELSTPQTEQKNPYLLPASVFGAAVVLAAAWIYTAGLKAIDSAPAAASNAESESAITLPVRWDNIGAELIRAGVIDQEAFAALYEARGGLTPEEQVLLAGNNNGPIILTEANAGFLLNLLWAFGLGNKNPILEEGPMSDPQYGGAENFASTGGWTLARGDAMKHFSAHKFIVLTPAQQRLVERVSKSIYRPCCDNSAYFPDCNHGMAMLGLLELLAANNVSEEDMYRYALVVNTLWFPIQYAAIESAAHASGAQVAPKELLGKNYSSASGYRAAAARATAQPLRRNGGGSCGA